jgi:endoglucanase
VLKGYDDALAKDCLETAIKVWNDEKAHPTQNPARGGLGGAAPAAAPGGGVLAASQGVVSGAPGGRNGRGSSGAPTSSGTTSAQTAPPGSFGRGGFGVGQDWAAALELTIATHGAKPYESRLEELFPQMITPQQMGIRGWTAVRALPYLDASAQDQMREAVKTYMADLNKQLDSTPFGVPPSLGAWGGSVPWWTWPFGCISCTRRFLI